jgi:1-acyl-sn-glycerol-3-phosphate acyltransferase
VEIGLVPFGSIGLTLFGIELYFASPTGPFAPEVLGVAALLGIPAIWRILFDLLMLGVFGGFFIVPLYALVQIRSSAAHRARIIAANNILNALFMVTGALGAAALLSNGVSIPALFGIAALANALVALYIYRLVPEFLLRFVAWLMIRAAYRLRSEGLDNMPEEGAAVIVCNHVSFADAVIVMGAAPRPLRFVMDHRIFKIPLLSYIFRHSGAIPIASAKEDPAMMEAAFIEVGKALAAGELVAIFPEGNITSDGELQPFRPGITRILADNPVPVIPLALSGLWGSFFSRIDGMAMKTPFRRGLLSRITLRAAPAIAPAEATPENLFKIVRALRGAEK